MLSSPLVRMGRMEDVGVRIGMCFTVMALSAVAGPPISGAINAATGGFKFTGIYAGTYAVVCHNAATDAYCRNYRATRRVFLDVDTDLDPWGAMGQVLDVLHDSDDTPRRSAHPACSAPRIS